MEILITDEMRNAAILESKKREPFINHHFEVSHFSSEESNSIGFLGEFCLCSLLNIDWKNNIRPDYLTIDQGDLVINEFVIDVKNEEEDLLQRDKFHF